MKPDATQRWERLTRLLEPFHHEAMATARRLCRTSSDGDDLYQETLLRAFDKLHTLRDESRFRSWFFATLISRHRTRHRRWFWKRLVPLAEAFPEGTDPIGDDGATWHDEARRSRRAAQALSTLPAVQREAVVLFEIDEFSIEEIATMQRASVSAVKSRLVRGRDALRRYYERCGDADVPGAARRGAEESTNGANASAPATVRGARDLAVEKGASS